MKALMFVPGGSTNDTLVALLTDIVASSHSVTVLRDNLSKVAWATQLGGCSLALVYVPAGSDFRLTPDLRQVQLAALALMDAAKDCDVPCVAFGPSLDRTFRRQLAHLGRIAFVSMRCFESFPSAFGRVLSQIRGEARSDTQLVSFLNVRADLCLSVTRTGILLKATDGYQDSVVFKPSTLGDRSPQAFIKLWRFLRSTKEADLLEQIANLGTLIGDYLFKHERARALYQTVLEVVGEPKAVPIYTELESDWQELPVEIAVPQPHRQMLCLVHPIIRQVSSAFRRQKWSPSTSRGLRILLIAADAFGQIEDCRYSDCRCSTADLPHVDLLDDEIRRLALFFKGQTLWNVELANPIYSEQATLENVTEALSQGWDIIHYAGHSAAFLESGRQCSCLFLSSPEDGILTKRARAVTSDYWVTAMALR